MLKLNLLAAVAATLLVGGTAVAKDETARAPKEKKICKGLKTSTSRIPAKKVCRTQAEWDEASSTTQEDLDDAAGRLRGMGRGN